MIIREVKTTYRKVGEMTGNLSDSIIDDPEKAWKAVKSFMEQKADKGELNPEREHFMVLFLNIKNRLKGIEIISSGTQDATLISPTCVFQSVVREGIKTIVVAHNHPSGDPTPSEADIRVTRQLREAAKILSVKLLDHVVCGEQSSDPSSLANFKGYYSFSDSGLL